MVSFKDGPAADVVLPLRRAPKLLRVVVSRKGIWDALDQLDDTPNPQEAIHVYRLTARATWMHIRATKRSASGMYAMADYAFVADPPAEEDLRDNARWRAWCEANHARLVPVWETP